MPKKDRKVYVVGANNAIREMFAQRDGYHVVYSAQMADIFCFIGGFDINPILYGEKPIKNTSIYAPDDQRDLLAYNDTGDKFKVGICRGGQFLNVKSGGQMWQHVNNHANGPHELIDLLFTNLSVEVTSTHHQMMIPGPDAEVLAFAKEATEFLAGDPHVDRPKPMFDTEVVWYPTTNCLCFQPHPEYKNSPKECTEYFFDLIDHFYEE